LRQHEKKDDLALGFFSTLTMLATPRDVILEELRIECFYPADQETEEAARSASAASACRTKSCWSSTAPR
jgi:hypothetical protein